MTRKPSAADTPVGREEGLPGRRMAGMAAAPPPARGMDGQPGWTGLTAGPGRARPTTSPVNEF